MRSFSLDFYFKKTHTLRRLVRIGTNALYLTVKGAKDRRIVSSES